jgi:hypothetical protein
MEPLNGHEAGNGGHSQGASCTPPRRSPTRLARLLQLGGRSQSGNEVGSAHGHHSTTSDLRVHLVSTRFRGLCCDEPDRYWHGHCRVEAARWLERPPFHRIHSQYRKNRSWQAKQASWSGAIPPPPSDLVFVTRMTRWLSSVTESIDHADP